MTSTFTPNANLEEPGAGDYAGTWNVPVNANYGLIDRIFGSTQSISMAAANVSLLTAGNQYQYARFVLTGALTADRTLSIPSGVGGFWIIQNNTTGAHTVTFLTTAGGSTGVSCPQGYQIIAVSDGTNCYSATTGSLPITGGTMTGALALPSNGLNVGSGQLVVTGGNITGSGSLTMAGDITAFSDRRVKREIKPIERALAKVKSLQGVTYEADTREPIGKAHIGLIAQEVKEVVPEVVYEMEDGHFTLAYGNLVGLLIEAIKELEFEVSYLKRRIA